MTPRPNCPKSRKWQTLKRSAESRGSIETYTNKYYDINKYTHRDTEGNVTNFTLAIYNKDRSAFHDWREFQKIKNETCGIEATGMEFYPPESSLIDDANVFMMYVLPESSSISFITKGRRVVKDADQARQAQRDFADE